jgi:integrase
MARTGLNVTRKRKADGSVVEYFYDRASRRFLGHDREAALERLQERPGGANPHRPDSLSWLITAYLERPEFRLKLAPRTQALYRQYLDEMRERYGDRPFRSVDAQTVEEIKATFADRPRKANQMLGLLRLLLGYALKLGLVRANAALRPGMLPTPPRQAVWSEEEEDAFLATADPRIGLAFQLMLYTGQRPSDVLALTTDCFTERAGRLWVRLRQEKTHELVEMPVHARLAGAVRERLAELEGKMGQPLVASPWGLPWQYRNFSRAWDAALKRSGLGGKQRRDLRRSAVVRMATAGATVPQIAAVTGWRVDYCQRIVHTYLPRRAEVALQAIDLWEEA